MQRSPREPPSAPVGDGLAEGAEPARIWSGTALQVLGRLWASGCTLVYLWMAAQALSQERFGRFTFYLAVFAWLDSLANMGTGQVTVQWTAAAAGRTAGVLATARRVRLAAGLLGVLLVGVGAFVGGEPDAGWILLASLYPVTHALELSATVFRNRIAWGVPVILRSLAAGLSLAGVVFLWRRGVDQPALYLVAVAAGSTVGNLFLHLAARRLLALDRPTVGAVQPAPLGAFLRAAVPLGLSGLCAQTYFYVDNLFVSAWCGDVELGRYNLAVRVLSALIMLAQYTSLTALPWFTRRHAAGDLGAAIGVLAAPTFALACFAVGMVWPLAPELLALFGEDFAGAASALRWLLGAVLAIYCGSLLLTALVASGSVRAPLCIAATGLLVNLLLNSLLVPLYGIDGAAAATFATEAWVAIGALWALRAAGVGLRTVFANWIWLAAPPAAAAGLLAGLLANFAPASLMGWG